MIDAILTGIFAKLPGTTLQTTLSGRLYCPYAPSGVIFPYGVVAIDTEHDWTFTEEIEEPDITFTLFSRSTGNTEITALIKQLIAIYDNTVLTVAGYTNYFCQRERVIGPIGAPDTDVRQATIIYNLMLVG